MKAKYAVTFTYENHQGISSARNTMFCIWELTYDDLDIKVIIDNTLPLLPAGSHDIVITDIRLLQNAPQ